MIILSKLKYILIDWFLLNKLFNIDYYFDNNEIQLAKNDIYTNLLWYNKSIKFWCSFSGLYEFISNIFIDNQINFDKNYKITRYYNKIIKENVKKKYISNSYLWNYKKLNKYEKPIWTNDINIEKQINFLEKNSDTINNLYNLYINESDIHPEQTTTLKKGNWKRLSILDIEGWKINNDFIENLKKNCNIAYNQGFIFFSKTESNTEIKEHYGSTNLRIRLHLGIIVKDKINTKLIVSDKKINWEEKKIIAFDDSFLHSSYNKSNYERVVFIIDIFNPYLNKNECKILKNNIFKYLGKIR